MIVGLILILLILCVNPFSLLSVLKPGANFLHELCLQKVHTEQNQWTMIYSALLCGERLPDGELKKTFITLGIIHLMVISGAHLIFLEKAWNLLPRFPFKNICLTVFLLIYSMSAGLKPPVLRALFSLLLSKINKDFKLFWSPYIRTHISGLLCLCCQSTWFNSLSLQMSWIASMGMSNHRFSKLQSCSLTFILILPIVSRWSVLHPLSILTNWLIAPLVSSILLPLSLLTLPFPVIRSITDKLWEYFIHILNWLKPFMENKGIEMEWSFNSFHIWIYICLIFILFHLYFVHSIRKKCY